MASIELMVKMQCGVRFDQDTDVFVSFCPTLGVYSQGETEDEALRAVQSAVVLRLTTAFDRNRLDKVLRKAGFAPRGTKGYGEVVSEAPEFVAVKVAPQSQYKEVHIEVPLTLLAAKGQMEHAGAC